MLWKCKSPVIREIAGLFLFNHLKFDTDLILLDVEIVI